MLAREWGGDVNKIETIIHKDAKWFTKLVRASAPVYAKPTVIMDERAYDAISAGEYGAANVSIGIVDEADVIVIAPRFKSENVAVASSLSAALERANDNTCRTCVIIGGADLYTELLDEHRAQVAAVYISVIPDPRWYTWAYTESVADLLPFDFTHVREYTRVVWNANK